ncbi:MAG: serine protease [Myxococcaceae bacterium]
MPALLALALLLAAPPPPRPSSAALQRALEAAGHSLVEVHGRRPGGAGVLVGAQGQVLTALRFVDAEGANVRLGTTVLGARLLLASPTLRVAVLNMVGPGPYPAMPVRLEAPAAGAWVVGIVLLSDGAAEPRLGRLLRVPGEDGPWLEVSVRLPPGSLLLDGSGKLLGVVVESRAASALAAPVAAVRAELESASPR